MEERVSYKHKVVVRFCHLLYTLCNIHEIGLKFEVWYFPWSIKYKDGHLKLDRQGIFI